MPVMKVCAIVAAAIAVFIALVLQLDLSWKFEIFSRMLYPLFRVGWMSGLLLRAMMHPIDDTGFKVLGDGKATDEMRSWRPEDGDVVVAAYAKSGSHFAAQATLQTMSNASEATGDKMESIHHFLVWPEVLTTRAVSTCEDKRLLTQSNYKEMAPLGKATLWVTHLDYDHVPQNKNVKYVVIARDPVDVLSSLQCMFHKMFGRIGPRAEELLPILEEASGGWAKYNLGWWKHRHEDNVLFLFYNDAINNPADMVTNISNLLGYRQDSEVVKRVVERSRFAYMRAKHEVFDPPACIMKQHAIKPADNSESIMMNKGTSGRGIQEVDEETKRYIREYCQKVLAGSDFPTWKLSDCK